MNSVMVVAFTVVRPVRNIHCSFRSHLDIDSTEPRSLHQHEVRFTLANVAAAFAIEPVDVDPSAVRVAHEDLAVVLLREIVALIDHRADVRVSAAEIVGDSVAAFIPFGLCVPMVMVGRHIHQLVAVRIEVLAVHPLIASSGDDVPQVSLHVVRHEPLAVFIVIQSPRIRRAVADDFDQMLCRMISPDAAVHKWAFFFWSSRNARI